jgi:hypothetical protein
LIRVARLDNPGGFRHPFSLFVLLPQRCGQRCRCLLAQLLAHQRHHLVGCLQVREVTRLAALLAVDQQPDQLGPQLRRLDRGRWLAEVARQGAIGGEIVEQRVRSTRSGRTPARNVEAKAALTALRAKRAAAAAAGKEQDEQPLRAFEHAAQQR